MPLASRRRKMKMAAAAEAHGAYVNQYKQYEK